MKEDSTSGASAFQQGFSKYCRKVAAGNHALLSHLKGQILPLQQLPSSVVPFGHERLKETEGKDQSKAASEIDKVGKSLGDTFDLKLPSGNSITLYSVQMTSGTVWACTKKEWKTFLAEYGLKEKNKHDDAGSNASLIDLL